MEKKGRSKSEVREDILAYLKTQTYPRTTGQIADAIRINWDSANTHLRKLKSEGVVYHEKVGRQNQWCLMEYYTPWRERLKALTSDPVKLD